MKTAKNLYDEVSKIVYGHDRAKKLLSTAIVKARAYYYQNIVKGLDVPNHSRVHLLMGHSGCGKTYLIQQLTKLADVPYVYIDATTINPGASGKGQSVNQIRKTLRKHADTVLTNDPLRYFSAAGVLSQTFVFVDEFDKMVRPYGSNDNWQERVQSEFLALIDGDDEFSEVNWVFAGAFSGLKEGDANNLTTIGFYPCKGGDTHENTTPVGLYPSLQAYGFTPELLGRISSVCKLDKLTEEDYTNIIRKTLIPPKLTELEHYTGKKPAVDDDFITETVKNATTSGQGVRYCKRELNSYFEELEFTLDYSFNTLDRIHDEKDVLPSPPVKGE